MIIIAVDLGKVRTGLAISDKNEILASPLCTIEERDTNALARKIADIAKEKNCELIVVGLPKNMDGSEGEAAKNARSFACLLGELTGLKIEMIDERGTTITAHNFMNEVNRRGKKRKQVIDAVSATIILESFFKFARIR